MVALPSFSGIPIHVDKDAPLHKWVEHDGPDGVPWVRQRTRENVDYTLVQMPARLGLMHMVPDRILVHPDRWPDFKKALEMLSQRKAEAN